jgi:hypothetical protein
LAPSSLFDVFQYLVEPSCYVSSHGCLSLKL